MNADREPNRLPLRAGAMLLLAVAVVFIGLGWHSAATGDEDPEAGLEAAQSRVSASTPTSSAAATSAASSENSSTKRLCVFNAGSVAGLAGEVTDELKAKGYRTASPGNISSGTITENTVFYDDGDKTDADKVAGDLGDDTSVDPRPSSFTQCTDGIPVIVVTR
ncbi:LytR C-terminal domain-containing protein [Gordonia soli]|uniref:LytR/CpsA/Psr regulator C-terminal domain-containing protein n=1 Tax=Gordonia soli NBRC 108243 TaxID=1223545 RepID=M0QP43_9ACTN|nr:LytR C-terminal domain-containing protein [Gordonia soli]GAC70046.1 hypothetical protein GS4_31_00120 [Gordonia soli NBRC 108243]